MKIHNLRVQILGSDPITTYGFSGKFPGKNCLIFENRCLFWAWASRTVVFSRFLTLDTSNLDDFFYQTKILEFFLILGVLLCKKPPEILRENEQMWSNRRCPNQKQTTISKNQTIFS